MALKPKTPTAEVVRYAPVRVTVEEGETDPDFYPPKKCHKEDAGFDLGVPRYLTIPPNGVANVPLNLIVAIPHGHVGLILPRLSAVTEGVKVEMGTLDAGYRGELSLLLRNTSLRTACLQAGYKAAQLVVIPLSGFRFVLDEDVLKERTDRTECP